MSNEVKACVFDAYGTLYDVAAAARRAAAEDPGDALSEHWPKLAEIWRAKQLEYSWLRAIFGTYKPFWDVTCDALDYALEALGLAGDPALRERLKALYRELDAYTEVPATLAALRGEGYGTAILSNGSPDMLAAAAQSARIDRLLDASISVEEVGVFKPDRRVYALAEQHMGATGREIAFFSSNGWDVTHAAAYGFKAIWVNRARAPVDRVGAAPDAIIPDLSEALHAVRG